jgi:Ca2+-transporting ATPase
MTFTALILSLVVLVLVNRSFSASILAAFAWENLAFGLVALAILLGLALVLAWPPARGLFGFGPLTLADLGLCLGAAVALLVGLELLKLLWRSRLVGTVEAGQAPARLQGGTTSPSGS